jgi:hypothetical protein
MAPCSSARPQERAIKKTTETLTLAFAVPGTNNLKKQEFCLIGCHNWHLFLTLI